jgi:hypothetical protein
LYAIRLPGHNVLYDHIGHLLTRPVGRPPKKPIVWYHSFSYQAGSWDGPRRVVAKAVTHSRYVVFQLAEVAVPRELFARILERIQGLGVPPPLVQRG